MSQEVSRELGIDKDFDVLKMELQEAISSFRYQLGVLAQVIGILAVANVTVIGFVVASRNAALLLAGALFPLVILGILQTAVRWVRPVMYSAITIEHQILSSQNGFVSSLVAELASPEFIEKALAISKEENLINRQQLLSKLPVPFLTGWGFVHVSLWLIALLQLAAVPVLVQVFGWEVL